MLSYGAQTGGKENKEIQSPKEVGAGRGQTGTEYIMSRPATAFSLLLPTNLTVSSNELTEFRNCFRLYR